MTICSKLNLCSSVATELSKKFIATAELSHGQVLLAKKMTGKQKSVHLIIRRSRVQILTLPQTSVAGSQGRNIGRALWARGMA